MLRIRLLGALVVALMTAAAGQAAQINVNEGPGNFGTLKQTDTQACEGIDGTQACGPTAAVNSFVFLENRYQNIYGGKLLQHVTNDAHANQVITANELGAADFMDCTCNGGTNIDRFITGKRDYIDLTMGPGITVFMHQDVFNLGDLGASKSKGQPSLAFLLQELQHGEDVEILVSYHDAQGYKDAQGNFFGGHYLTMTGLMWTDADDSGGLNAGDALKLNFIDPLTGAPGSANAFANGFGFDTDYGGGASISAIVSESPVPEPETLALLLVGLLGLAGLKARRAQA